MNKLRRHLSPGPFLLGMPILLALLPASASAASVAHLGDDLRAISVLAMPIRGMLILIIISLPVLLGRGYVVEPVRFHLANVLAAVMLLSLVDALVVPFAVIDGIPTTLAFVLAGSAVLLVTMAVFARHLLFQVHWATVVGGALALGSMAWWYILLDLPPSQIHALEDFLVYTFAVGMLAFLGLLALETLRHHHRREDGRDGPGWRGDEKGEMGEMGEEKVPSIHVRTRRLGEMLIAAAIVGILNHHLWS